MLHSSKILAHQIEDLTFRVQALEHWKRSFKSNTLEISSMSAPDIPLAAPNLAQVAQEVAHASPQGPVYPKLVSWLIEPASRRVGSWSKIFSASNNVRQLLFEREQKAVGKYGEGLKFESGPEGLSEAALKIGDAIFFLYKFFSKKGKTVPTKRTEIVDQDQKLKQIEELITLLQNLAADIRKNTPAPSQPLMPPQSSR